MTDITVSPPYDDSERFYLEDEPASAQETGTPDPLGIVRPASVMLLPVDPETQDGDLFLSRYPRGCVVRLGLTDGVVLAHCLEQAEGDTPPVPALMVTVTDPGADAGPIRVWRESQIVDSPLSDTAKATMRTGALALPTPPAVMALLRGWEARHYRPEPAAAGILTADATMVTGAPRAAADQAEPGPSADGLPAPDMDDDIPFSDDPPPMIPVSILDYVSDTSVCEIRRKAAAGAFGSDGYAEIDGAFRARAEMARMAAEAHGADDDARLRHAMFHYCGLYVDLIDEGDIDHPGCR